MEDIIKKANRKMQKELPQIKQQKELLQKALISRDSIKIALYGRQPDIGQIEPGKAQGNLRSGLPDWLPGLDSNQGPRLQRAV